MLEILLNWLAEPKNWIPSPITTVIALLALAVANSNYRRKSGIDIAGSYQWEVDFRTDQPYIKELRLENRKDKAITIYFVFLKIGNNIYLELQNHEDNPLILKAFESYQSKLDLIAGYTSNATFVNISRAFLDDSISKEIVLATGSGKFHIRKKIKHWHAREAFFQKPEVSLITPFVVAHRGTIVGNRTKYIVEIRDTDTDQVTSLLTFPNTLSELPEDIGLTISPYDLESIENLELFLLSSQKKGIFSNSSSFNIIFNPHYNDPSHGIKGSHILAKNLINFWHACFLGKIKRFFGTPDPLIVSKSKSPHQLVSKVRSLSIWLNNK